MHSASGDQNVVSLKEYRVQKVSKKLSDNQAVNYARMSELVTLAISIQENPTNLMAAPDYDIVLMKLSTTPEGRLILEQLYDALPILAQSISIALEL